MGVNTSGEDAALVGCFGCGLFLYVLYVPLIIAGVAGIVFLIWQQVVSG